LSEKPSYVGLLNAIAVGESQAECYLEAWASTTPRDDVRQVLTTIALREGEHGKAFAKRLCELGYSVLPRDEDKAAERLAIAASCELSDREKFEKLGLSAPIDDSKPDIFSAMFNDRSIDIQTGALLGRYIAEERDSGRMFQDCYTALCADDAGSNGRSNGADTNGSLGRIEQLLEQLVTKLG
jgi:rubrerythrin